jgi:iron complex outermembrane recepter protein
MTVSMGARGRGLAMPVLLLGPALGTPALADTAPATAAAAPAEPSTGEILVTAQRRSQSVLSVPLAISALGGNTLATKGVTTSLGLAEAVPNLQVSTNFGTAQPNFSMRGVSVGNEYNSNQVSPVGVYIDDVYLAARASHGMGLFDLDRVEVLRGPQGTLFGRNTTGGAINFITRQPKLDGGTNGYADIGYGNFNTFTGQGAIETTTDDGQLGIRAAVNYVKGDGEFKNIHPGSLDPNSQDTLQGRVALRFRPTGSGLDIKIRAYAGRDNPTSSAVYGPASARQGLDFFTVNEGNIGHFRTSAWGVMANVSYEIQPGLTLTSITSYDGGRLDMQSQSDGTPEDGDYAATNFYPGLNIHWYSKFRQFTEETRINYESGKLKLVGGVFYGWDSTNTDNDFNIGVVPISATTYLTPGGFFQHYIQNRYSLATFLQGDYEIAPRLTLTLGARETWDKSHYDDGYAYLYSGGILGGTPETPLATTVPCYNAAGCAYDPNARYALHGNNSALTGRVALSYKFDDGLLAYASYNRGYRSGAFNGGAYTSQAGINYVAPERVNAYEVGLKGHALGRAITFSTAAFYYDYTNQQLQNTLPGPVAILVNAPKSEIYGAEAEATWHAASTLSFNGSVGVLHAQYKELTLQGVNLSGQDLPFAPHFTGQIGMDWALYRHGADEVTLSPNLAYTGHVFFTPFNLLNATSAQDNAELQQNGYAKVNAQLAWKHGPYQVRAWVQNAFNAKVLAYGLDLRGAGFPYNYLVPANPRTFGVSARMNF